MVTSHLRKGHEIIEVSKINKKDFWFYPKVFFIDSLDI